MRLHHAFGAAIFAAATIVVGANSANAAPAGVPLAQTQVDINSVQAIDYRGYRHCHWRYGRRWCHGARGYRGWYGPGIHLHFGTRHRGWHRGHRGHRFFKHRRRYY